MERTTAPLARSSLVLLCLSALLCACGGGSGAATPPAPPTSVDGADDSYVATSGEALSVPAPGVLANDAAASGTRLQAMLVSGPAEGSVQLRQDGSFTYVASPAATGTDRFEYRVTGGASGAIAAVILHINHRPLAPDRCTDIPRGQSGGRAIVLPGQDQETPATALTYSVTQPAHGHVDTSNTSTVTYTPDADAPWGRDAFTYTVTDADGASATGQIDVVIRPRIMPLGDSITQGEYDQYDPGGNTPGASAGYRKPLWEALAKAGYRVDFVGGQASGPSGGFDRDHQGMGGIRSRAYADAYTWDGSDHQGVSEHIGAWLANTPADIILLHIGTNDFNTHKTADQIYSGTAQILSNIRDWAASEPSVGTVELLLGQIVGGNQAANFTNAEVRRLDYELLPQLAGDQITLVDQYGALDRNHDQVPDPGLYANTLHPDQAGYNAMAAAWEAALAKLLDRRGAGCPL